MTRAAIPASFAATVRSVNERSATRFDRILDLDADVRIDLGRRESRSADDRELARCHGAAIGRRVRADVSDADRRTELQPGRRSRNFGLGAGVGDGLLASDAVGGSLGARRVAHRECAGRVVLHELRDQGGHAVDLVALDRDLLVRVEGDHLLAPLPGVVSELRLELERAEDDVAVLNPERAGLRKETLNAGLELAGDVRADWAACLHREREIGLAGRRPDARLARRDDAWRGRAL